MADDTIVLDTTIAEPPLTAGEVEMLLFALERARAQFAWKCGGLDAQALRRPFPPSAMTLAGLVKHMAEVEDYYTATALGGDPMSAHWPAEAASMGWIWGSAIEDPPEELYARWRDAVARTRAAVRRLLTDGGLDQPTTLIGGDPARSPNLRRLLVDIQSEYSRHTGHADLFREAIDGLVGEDPPQPAA